MLVSSSATVNSLDIFGVHVDGGSGVLNDLIPFAHGAVASSSVGVEDGVSLAENGLGVEVNGFVVGLVAVGLVTGLLQLRGILLTLLLGKGSDNLLIDLGQLRLALDGGRLGLRSVSGSGSRWRLGSLALGLFSLSPLLLAKLGGCVLVLNCVKKKPVSWISF